MRSALDRWEPRIDVQAMDIDTSEVVDEGTLLINIH